MSFILQNNNPKKRKDASDCVIQALATALDTTWEDINDTLHDISCQLYVAPTSMVAVKFLLSDKQQIPAIFNHKRITPKTMCNFKGTFILQLANHLTCVKDGHYYDKFDCGNKCAYRIWVIK